MALLRRLSPDQRRSLRHWGMEFVVVVAGVVVALGTAAELNKQVCRPLL